MTVHGNDHGKPRVVHLVPAGRPLGTTVCGLETETPDRPWRPGLVPDANWAGPLGAITCPECLSSPSSSGRSASEGEADA